MKLMGMQLTPSFSELCSFSARITGWDGVSGLGKRKQGVIEVYVHFQLVRLLLFAHAFLVPFVT